MGPLDLIMIASSDLRACAQALALDRIFTKGGTNVAAELKAAAPQAQALLDKSGRPPAKL